MCGGEHVLDKYPISRGGIVDEDVGHGSHQLAVLNDGGAGHECGQQRATTIHKVFTQYASSRILSKAIKH